MKLACFCKPFLVFVAFAFTLLGQALAQIQTPSSELSPQQELRKLSAMLRMSAPPSSEDVTNLYRALDKRAFLKEKARAYIFGSNPSARAPIGLVATMVYHTEEQFFLKSSPGFLTREGSAIMGDDVYAERHDAFN
jgi:hypothetical protein